MSRGLDPGLMSVIPLGWKGAAIFNRDLVSEVSAADVEVAEAIENRGSFRLNTEEETRG
jgi:hypothetical protein